MQAVAIHLPAHPLAGIQRVHLLILEIPQEVLLLFQARPTLTGTIVIAPEVKTRVGVILMKTMIKAVSIKPVIIPVFRIIIDQKDQDQWDQEAMAAVNAVDKILKIGIQTSKLPGVFPGGLFKLVYCDL